MADALYLCGFKCGKGFPSLAEKFAHMRECLKGAGDDKDIILSDRGGCLAVRVRTPRKNPVGKGGVAKGVRQRKTLRG